MKPYPMPTIKEHPTQVTGPNKLLNECTFQYWRTKPENIKKVKPNLHQIYFKMKRGDGSDDFYYYSKWELSFKERWHLLWHGTLYLFLRMPPPHDMPPHVLPMLEPLEMRRQGETKDAPPITERY